MDERKHRGGDHMNSGYSKNPSLRSIVSAALSAVARYVSLVIRSSSLPAYIERLPGVEMAPQP